MANIINIFKSFGQAITVFLMGLIGSFILGSVFLTFIDSLMPVMSLGKAIALVGAYSIMAFITIGIPFILVYDTVKNDNYNG